MNVQKIQLSSYITMQPYAFSELNCNSSLSFSAAYKLCTATVIVTP